MRRIVALAARVLWLVPLLLLAASPALARGCFPIAQGGGIQLASLPAGSTVGVTYLDHSSFWIETAQGITAITDYNNVHRGPTAPHLVTMNNAHSTHYTNSPEPGIEHVLRGWNPEGGTAEHDVETGDLRVRNIPTSVHGRSGIHANSNSIFVFEVEDLCIAHLGHLHHVLTDMHLGELGIIDILMVPIDGGMTMAQELMREVIAQIRPSVVLPMHYFGTASLNRFLDLMGENWQVVIDEGSTARFDRLSLPTQQVRVLQPVRY